MSDEEKITDEDHLMLVKLAASLNVTNYTVELDWEALMVLLDVIYNLGADVVIMFGRSITINLDEKYFLRTEVTDDLGKSMFIAINDFSHWYLKNNYHKTSINGE